MSRSAVIVRRSTTLVAVILIIALAVLVLRALRREAFGRSGSVAGRARLLAATSLILWAGAITAGRLMAYTSALK